MFETLYEVWPSPS